MARSFSNADSSVIQATIRPITGPHWSIFGWVYVTAQPSSFTSLMRVEAGAGTYRHSLGIHPSGSGVYFSARQWNNSQLDPSGSTRPLNTWHFVCAQFGAAPNGTRATWLYVGSLTQPMAQYGELATGNFNDPGTGTNCYIGSTGTYSTQESLTGRLERVGIVEHRISLAGMEKMRLGHMSGMFDWAPQDGAPAPDVHSFWPLDSPTLTQAEDLFDGNHGAVSGCGLVEGPPVPPAW